MTTKAIDVWMNAKTDDQKFVLCELAISSETVLDDDIGNWTKKENERCSAVVKAAREPL